MLQLRNRLDFNPNVVNAARMIQQSLSRHSRKPPRRQTQIWLQMISNMSKNIAQAFKDTSSVLDPALYICQTQNWNLI